MSIYFKDEYKKYLDVLERNPKKNINLSIFTDNDYISNFSTTLNGIYSYESGLNEMNSLVVPELSRKSKILRDNVNNLSSAYNLLYDKIYPLLVDFKKVDDEYENDRRVYKQVSDGKSILDKLNEISERNLPRKIKLKKYSEDIEKYLTELKNYGDNVKLFRETVVPVDNGFVVVNRDGSNTVIWDTLGEKFVVAKTNLSAEEYANFVKQNGIYQASNSAIYGDSCLAFAYIHASNLATGNTSDRANSALGYVHAGEFSDYRTTNKQEALAKIYSEINEGKPVVLQVNGNSKGTARHFVTVVGYKDSVTDPNKMSEKDLLILDTWDGQIERMDTSASRFMTTGEQVGHNYSGYYLRTLK